MFYDHSNQRFEKSFLDFMFAKFATVDFEAELTTNATLSTAEEPYDLCRYPEFRNPPGENQYKRPDYYWKILAARLAFIIIFQNVVAWLQQFIDWVIPDKPSELDSLIKRENYLVSNKIIKEERRRVIHNSRAKLNEVDYVNGGVYFEAKS